MSGIIAQNVGRHGGLIKAPSGGGGAWTLIQTLTSDGSDSDLSFTSGIDSTYDEYVFKFINIHPASDSDIFYFNLSSDGGSNYNVTKTSSFFKAIHGEGDLYPGITYRTSQDLAQSTAYQQIEQDIGADNDQSISGCLHLFQPSSTTFVKHFILYANSAHSGDNSMNPYCGGYGNTTSAIDAVQFKFSGPVALNEIQGGSISMYGIS